MNIIQENLFRSIAVCDLLLNDIGCNEEQNETQMRRFKVIEIIKEHLTQSIHKIDEFELENLN